MIDIRPEPPRQPDIIALLEASDANAHALDPPESNHLLDIASLEKTASSLSEFRRLAVPR